MATVRVHQAVLHGVAPAASTKSVRVHQVALHAPAPTKAVRVHQVFVHGLGGGSGSVRVHKVRLTTTQPDEHIYYEVFGGVWVPVSIYEVVGGAWN